ncbi:hypothetical protein ACIGW4_33585 [Streptomyces sp. NPDC053513]|uniref:hypothetical protein n=1 Tax=unclassified Streptomyces TaxID=2593676 RepID=UPI0037D6B5F4
MATLVTDPLPQAEQHPAGAQPVVQDHGLRPVGRSLRSLESSQVAVVDTSDLAELAKA